MFPVERFVKENINCQTIDCSRHQGLHRQGLPAGGFDLSSDEKVGHYEVSELQQELGQDVDDDAQREDQLEKEAGPGERLTDVNSSKHVERDQQILDSPVAGEDTTPDVESVMSVISQEVRVGHGVEGDHHHQEEKTTQQPGPVRPGRRAR